MLVEAGYIHPSKKEVAKIQVHVLNSLWIIMFCKAGSKVIYFVANISYKAEDHYIHKLCIFIQAY